MIPRVRIALNTAIELSHYERLCLFFKGQHFVEAHRVLHALADVDAALRLPRSVARIAAQILVLVLAAFVCFASPTRAAFFAAVGACLVAITVVWVVARAYARATSVRTAAQAARHLFETDASYLQALRELRDTEFDPGLFARVGPFIQLPDGGAKC
jgi:hypothetical protein